MKKAKIQESKGSTHYIKGKGIPKGCQYCLNGKKTVLFINGICQKPEHCSWYCPISETRRGKDSTFADEIEISSKEELLAEINTINAKGMSITGGDPLLTSNIEKTLDYIKFIKSIRGKKFHIHLYTNGINFNESIAIRLANAGLDEIRFHPPKSNWIIIKNALNKGISVGAEVPVIPEPEYIKDLEEFIFYLDKIGAEFINLNEFEYCFPNSKYLKGRGFSLKEGTIASVENSKTAAINMLKKLSSKVSIKMHFCTIIAKDYFQLKSRYLRRAKSIKLPYEEITEEGLLIYAQIEGELKVMNLTYEKLLNDYKIPLKLLNFDGTVIKLPLYIALNEFFMELLGENDLKCNVIEIIPFREEKYFQITESTPIKVFKQERYED